jgi:hypothetical protein
VTVGETIAARPVLAGLAVAGALGAALVPGAARATAPCTLEVGFEPPALTLGAGARAVVRIDGALGEPVLAVSPGRIEGLRREGSRWIAEYVAPDEPWPQVAVVAALEGEASGGAALPLHGRGTAEVRTRPRAEVEVRIGARSFGPVRAGPDGRAEVAVVVPPGVRAATRGAQVIPLEAPAIHPLALVLEAPRARADRTERVRGVLVAATDTGGPWVGPAPGLRASEGEVDAGAACGPGVFPFTWTLAPGVPRVARAAGRREDVAPALEVSLALVAGPAARVEVISPAPAARAGRTLALDVRVLDAAGNPAAGVPEVGADRGELGSPEAAGAGRWTVPFTAPRDLGGARAAHVRVRVDGPAGPVGEAELALQPGPPARIEVGGPARTLQADGRTAAALRVRVADAFGNLTPVAPEAWARLGTVAPPGRDREEWVVAYRTPLSRTAVEDAVDLRAGDASTQVAVALVAPPRRLALGAWAGLALRPGSAPAPAAGAFATAWPWRLRGRLGFGLGIAGSTFRRDATLDAGVPVRFTARARLVAVEAAAVATARRGPWLGSLSAGPGLAVSAAWVEQSGAVASSGTGVAPAFHVALSLGRPTGAGVPFALVRAAWQGPAGGGPLEGEVTTFTFGLGWRLDAR